MFIKKQFKRIILMIQFMTTIPVPVNLDVDNDDFGHGLIYAPVIGFLIGALLYFSAILLNMFCPAALCAILLFAIYIKITGGLQFDGLGDTFDGVFSNRPKEKILEIMRDSRCGTNAVIAICFFIIFYIYSFWFLISSQQIIYIIFFPVIGRFASLSAAGVSKYAREGFGLGKSFIDICQVPHILTGAVLAMIPGFIFYGINGLFFVAGAFIISVLLVKYYGHKIGGATGDILGAVCETTQTVYLLFIIILTGKGIL